MDDSSSNGIDIDIDNSNGQSMEMQVQLTNLDAAPGKGSEENDGISNDASISVTSSSSASAPLIHSPRSTPSPSDSFHENDTNTNTNTNAETDRLKGTSQHRPVRTVAWISGEPGCGKSALAMNCRSQIEQEGGKSLFVYSKFEDQQLEEPYYTIKDIMRQLCEHMHGSDIARPAIINETSEQPQTPPPSAPTLAESLRLGMTKEERTILCGVIPKLSKFITAPDEQQQQADQPRGILKKSSFGHDAAPGGHKSDKSSTQSQSQTKAGKEAGTRTHKTVETGYREQSDRLLFVFSRFFQIVCDYRPLVLAIDNVQWIDRASMDLIQSWLLDVRIRSLMIVCCYRSNQLEENGSLVNMMETVQKYRQERSIHVISITLENMSLDNITTMLKELLHKTTDEEVADLAQIVYRRTNGSAYFVQQYLQSLVQDGLLRFKKESTVGWAWDKDAILARSSATLNVIELMQDKVRRLQEAKLILPVAACLGFTFSKWIMVIIIRTMMIHSSHSKFFQELFGVSTFLSEEQINDSLSICERSGLVEAHGSSKRRAGGKRKQGKRSKKADASSKSSKRRQYSFIHEKVREAAMSLIATDRLNEFQYRVGDVLLSSLTPDEQKGRHFLITNLINKRLDLIHNEKTGDRRMKIVELNYKAGTQSTECSSFDTALQYFQNAMLLLPKDHWKSHLQLSINIYSSAAECASLVPKIALMEKYCSIIIRLDCDVLKKIRAYHVLIGALMTESAMNQVESDQASELTKAEATNGGDRIGADSANTNGDKGNSDKGNGEGTDGNGDRKGDLQQKKSTCLQLCLSLLEELGCHFPKSKFGRTMALIRGMVRTKMGTSRYASDVLQDIRVLNDETETAIMGTLNRLASVAYVTDPDLMPLVTFKRVRRAQKFGVTSQSPPAFAYQAMVVGFFLGDVRSARNIASVALAMSDAVDDQATKAETMLIVNSMTWHWMNPLEEVRQNLLQSYQVGMSTGSVEFAMWSIYHYLQKGFFVGLPLPKIDWEVGTYSRTMHDFRQHHQLMAVKIFWQAVQNLLGTSNHTTKLIGDAIDEDEILGQDLGEMGKARLVSFKIHKLMCATYFGEYEVGADLVEGAMDDIVVQFAGLAMLPMAAFYGGFCCYAAASDKTSGRSKSKRQRYLRGGRKCQKMLKGWTQTFNPNYTHNLKLLVAEEERCHGKAEKAIASYRRAVQWANQQGIMHDQALASERLATLLLEVNNAKSNGSAKGGPRCHADGTAGDADASCDGRREMKDSIKLYRLWGANGKVKASEAMKNKLWGS